jgi:hypothetical protein
MLQWLRDLFAGSQKPYFSAEQLHEADQRRQREQEWFDSLVQMQEAGQIEQAAKQALADMDADRLNFVLEPMERVAMLYAREVDRLLKSNDPDGARKAMHSALHYMGVWASWSTSGGEGTARSQAGEVMRTELESKLQQYNARTEAK